MIIFGAIAAGCAANGRVDVYKRQVQRFEDVAMRQRHRTRQVGQFARGELQRRLREIDALVAARRLFPQHWRQRRGVAAAQIEESWPPSRKARGERTPQGLRDLAVEHEIGGDHLVISVPLVKNIWRGRGGHGRGS